MTPFLYSLCQKPVVGIAMAAVALCEFPPLLKDATVKLDAAGSVLNVDVDVPVDLSYTLLVEMSTASGDSLPLTDVAARV